MEIRSEERV